MHDDRLAHDVRVRLAVQRRARRCRVDLRDAFSVGLDVEHVAGMVRAAGRIAVLSLGRIEVTAGAAAVRRAAIAFLVHVEAEVGVGLQALDRAGDVHAFRRLRQCDRAGDGVALGRRDLRDGFRAGFRRGGLLGRGGRGAVSGVRGAPAGCSREHAARARSSRSPGPGSSPSWSCSSPRVRQGAGV